LTLGGSTFGFSHPGKAANVSKAAKTHKHEPMRIRRIMRCSFARSRVFFDSLAALRFFHGQPGECGDGIVILRAIGMDTLSEPEA
jgi:hypothetical protein